MSPVRCSRCHVEIRRKTSTESLCDRCEGEDRVCLAEALAYLKETEAMRCMPYQLSDSFEGIDDNRIRRWIRMGVLDKTSDGKITLISSIKKHHSNPIAQYIQTLLQANPIQIQDMQFPDPKMVTDELSIQDDT